MKSKEKLATLHTTYQMLSNAHTSKGITLVTLVITIIILLILCGVTISTLGGDNGIVNNAKKINNKMNTEQNESMQEIQNGENSLSDKLIPDPWIQTNDGTIKKGDITVKIGDYVNYNCKTEASYTSYSEANASTSKNNGRTSGYTADQVFNAKDYTGEWRILGVNSNDELEIMAATNVKIASGGNNGKYYYLRGKKGYTDGIEELNAIGSIYGNGTGATSARSINVNDINRITGYNPDIAKYNDGIAGPDQWGNTVAYTLNSGKVYYKGTKYPTDSTSSSYPSFTYYNENSKSWLSLREGESKTLVHTHYYYYPNTLTTSSGGATVGIETTSKEYSTLFGNSTSEYYWLGSLYTSTHAGLSGFGMRFVSSGYVDTRGLYNSNDSTYSDCFGIRPVVSLSTKVQLKNTSTQKDGFNVYDMEVK